MLTSIIDVILLIFNSNFSITNKLATTKAPKAKFGNYMHLDSTMVSEKGQL